MAVRSVRRLLRRARDGFRRTWHARSAAALRREILRNIEALNSADATPYYARLAEAAQTTGEIAWLREMRRTLQASAEPGEGPGAPSPPQLVSIIMPVHNRAGIVGEAIRSILAQTYRDFELIVCDDGSSDATAAVLERFEEPRIRLVRHPERRGAAAARNTCLTIARGEYVAYLDSDNLWHPRFLQLAIAELQSWPGHSAAYAGYFDMIIEPASSPALKAVAVRAFDLEQQIDKPYVDLNSFVHRRELTELFGGFDERLRRRQDYDVIARYTWLREPRQIPLALNIYQRSAALQQITQVEGRDTGSPAIIKAKIEAAYREGLPARFPPWLKRVTVVSWDMSRNHFAKAFSVAEALSPHLEVELVSFRFFEDPIFPPLAGVTPSFATHYFEGANFPAFSSTMDDALTTISGDVIYAVKPRLPSFGLALLANARSGTPVFLEANDLETVVSAPRPGDRHSDLPLSAILENPEASRVPHAEIWSQVLDRCAQQLPTIFTHNTNLDVHYGRRCLPMRNIKDPSIFDPERIDRDAVRAELGFAPEDRVILFGGLVRQHKGIFELADFVQRLGRPYKLLVVGSRETPDLKALNARAGDAVTVLAPQPPERMAALNAAADIVVLWLDPAVPASHFQSPYKMTDALATGPAIIASPIGDFPRLAERGLVWTVPYGDFPGLAATVRRIFSDGEERRKGKDRGRQVFLREYSYRAVAPALALAAHRLYDRGRPYPVAQQFATVMEELHTRLR